MNQSRAKQVRNFVQGRVARLMHTYNRPMVNATLAKLRRGIGKPPGSLPELWDITLEGLQDSQAQQPHKGEHPRYEESAVHTALTLFALHQQGKEIKTQCMHAPDVSLGKAMRQLIRQKPEREEAIKRRFIAATTSDSYEELTWHVRGLIQLLRSEEIGLDYAKLAGELYRFQFPDNRDGIRLQWGRELYWQPSEKQAEDQDAKNSETQE